MDPTIFWQYAKKIEVSKANALILTGLLSPCGCPECSGNFSGSKVYMRDSSYVYKVGSSPYYLQFRSTYNLEEDFYLFSYFKGCPRSNGYIVGGFEEVLENLDDLDKDKALFNLDLFK